MTNREPLPDLPLIAVYEDRDRRRYPRLHPTGMIGTLWLTSEAGSDAPLEFVGLDVSRSGAALLIAPSSPLKPHAAGHIDIYSPGCSLRHIPFRVVRTRTMGRLVIAGICFDREPLPVTAVRELIRGRNSIGSHGLQAKKLMRGLMQSQTKRRTPCLT